MADKFEELIAQNKQPDKEINVEGVFGCQTCDKNASGAHYDPVEGTMEWACESGHVSKIKAQF
jgi:hypothetical protein